jgi:hypothetical protein
MKLPKKMQQKINELKKQGYAEAETSRIFCLMSNDKCDSLATVLPNGEVIYGGIGHAVSR